MKKEEYTAPEIETVLFNEAEDLQTGEPGIIPSLIEVPDP